MKLTSTILSLVLCAGLASASDSDTSQGNRAVVGTPKTNVQKTLPKKGDIKRKSSKKKPQIGAASWYGKGFQGRPTASGELYDMYQLTAASKSLPLGTWVKVTNLRNGKWLIVKVNDRGPYVGNRIMDVSYSAAKMLDFKSQGLARVKLEVVEPELVASNYLSSPLD